VLAEQYNCDATHGCDLLTLLRIHDRLAKVAFLTENKGRLMALSKEMEEAISKLPAEQQVSSGKGDDRSMAIAEKKQQYQNQTVVMRLPSRTVTHPPVSPCNHWRKEKTCECMRAMTTPIHPHANIARAWDSVNQQAVAGGA
jgi:hypothetical protein